MEDIDIFLKMIKQKYNYDDELIKALKIVIPLFDEEPQEEIFNVINNVRIFLTEDMSLENQNKIRKEMLQDKYQEMEEPEDNMYHVETEPGSYYSYEPLFDEENNFKEEIRWLVLKKEPTAKYQSLFNTTINIPYLIHELEHAYMMQKPMYEKSGENTLSKHGMLFEEYSKINNTMQPIRQEDIILEEMFTELFTQEKLVRLLKKQDYTEVSQELKNINHVNTSYNILLTKIAEIFQNTVGKERIYNYRKYNDFELREDFNETAKESNIKDKYFKKIDAWKYLSDCCTRIFGLSHNKLNYSLEEYKELQKNEMMKAFAPIHAYKEIKYNSSSLQNYENIGKSIR